MREFNLDGLKDIKADKELIERTVNKVMNNNKSKKYFNIRKSVAVAASLLLVVGAVSAYPLYKGYFGAKENNNTTIVENKGIEIPAVNLKPSNGGVQAKMMPLVVYKGKVYLGSITQVPQENIKNFIGEKIGRTVNSIDEWNVKDKSTEEMASNIGEQDIYTVKGYDDSFRIMSYSEFDGNAYGEFFDCVNGITVKSGKDIFGKLNIVDNIVSAKSRDFDGWNNGLDNYADLSDLNKVNEFSKEINKGIPFSYETVEKDIESSRNNEGFREVIITLKDGCIVTLSVFKNGYVYYGNSNIYFKVDNSVIENIWK